MRARVRSGRRVSDRDLGYSAAVRALRGLRGTVRVVVGIRGEAGGSKYSSGASLVDVGTAHEYGYGVPARPFLGPTVDSRRSEYLSALGEEVAATVKGEQTLEEGLGRLGLRVVGDVQHTIDTMTEPALAPETVLRKGSSALLVDTGRLKGSIDSEVRRG